MSRDLFNEIMTDLEQKATYNEAVFLSAIREVLEGYVGDKKEACIQSTLPALWTL